MGARSARIGAALIAAWLGAAFVSAPVAADEICRDVGARCGPLVKADCLARIGAGALEAAPATCAGQFELYRACLSDAAEKCAGPGAEAGTPQAFLASLTTDLCALGVWTGPIIEPRSEIYTMRLEIGSRNGRPFARMRYPELACASRGDHLSGPSKGRIRFREVVTENRARCADGEFVVTCMADGRLHWRWFRDNGENFDAILSR